MTEPRTLRLTGQQIDSIQPPVPDAWLIDFDEYEDFIIAPAAGVDVGDEGLRTGDAAKLRTLATWFDHFDDWREATGKIASGIAEYREVQDDLRRIAAALAAQENPA